jgi:hypothetical protein
MSKKTDITLTVSPLSGVTPVGISLSFSVGAIPVCAVDFAPAEPGGVEPKISTLATGILENPDRFKRQTPITVDISVKETAGKQGSKTHKLKWEGLLDGVSSSINVGGVSYQAILKGKAQALLELTTMTPGLTPGSISIWKNPFVSILHNSDNPDDQIEESWLSENFSTDLEFSYNPLKFYVKMLPHILEIQANKFDLYMGNEADTNNDKAFEKVMTDARYKKGLTKGIELLKNIDISAVNGGTIDTIKAGGNNCSGKLKDLFFRGSNVLLENLMGFLSFLGCTIVFGSDKMFVVPERSFIRQSPRSAGPKQQSSTTNVAYPADYNGYSYSDNGYRDVFAVILSNKFVVSGTNMNDKAQDASIVGYYKDEHEITKASGVLVVQEHPFSYFSTDSINNAHDAKDLRDKLDGGKDVSVYANPEEYGANEDDESQKTRADEKQEAAKTVLPPEALQNYAEIKFYQARYGDRRGSITLSFNPNWVPGASGSLVSRFNSGGGFSIDFWVESVTHKVDMTPPAGGSAVTIVNFCCGRMGSSPIGVSEDKFTGYNEGKETAFKSAFISDIGAS